MKRAVNNVDIDTDCSNSKKMIIGDQKLNDNNREGNVKIGNTVASRLGKCEVCGAQDARYCCPKCEVKSCSIHCIQIHKKELDCNGIRDRTKFIPLRKMTPRDFMSDYYFLEECTRYVTDRRNDQFKNFTRYNKLLPRPLFVLRNAASSRKIKLRFLLENFSRRKENTTFFDHQERKIFWRTEWIFVNAADGLKYVDDRCDETVPLELLLDKYISPDCVEPPVPQKRELVYYQSVGVHRLKVLLKAEGIKHSKRRFYELDVSKSLKENLSGKTLVEFPCIFLSYEENPSGFDIIDSDEDIESETKSHEAKMEDMRKKLLAFKDQNKSQYVNKNLEAANAADTDELGKLVAEKQNDQRQQKRDQFKKAPNNYLFADETLWDMFSSESENEAAPDGAGNETEEEK